MKGGGLSQRAPHWSVRLVEVSKELWSDSDCDLGAVLMAAKLPAEITAKEDFEEDK